MDMVEYFQFTQTCMIVMDRKLLMKSKDGYF